MSARLVILALSAAAGLVSAQATFTQCCNLTSDQVSTSLATTWCRAQKNSCPELCLNGQTAHNDCDPVALTYNCQCYQGTTPNISDFGQTFPSLECEEWKGLCVQAHPNDLTGQTFCLSFKCGSKNATAYVPSGSSTSSAPGSSSSGTSTGSSSSSSSSGLSAANKPKPAVHNAATSVLTAGKQYGTGVVGALLFALFALVL